MANEDIGEIACPFTGKPARIRKAKQGRFPLYIYTEFAGPIFLKTPQGQDYILSNGRLYGADKPEPGEAKAPPVTAPAAAAPAPAPAEKPAKKPNDGWLIL